MTNIGAIELALREKLPPELHHEIPRLVEAIDQALRATTPGDTRAVELDVDPQLKRSIERLAGQSLRTEGATIDFGAANQVGDLSINSVASRDVINMTVHVISQPKPLTAMPWLLVGGLVLLGVAAAVFLWQLGGPTQAVSPTAAVTAGAAPAAPPVTDRPATQAAEPAAQAGSPPPTTAATTLSDAVAVTAPPSPGASLDPGLATVTSTPPPPASLNITNNPGVSDAPRAMFDASGVLHVIWLDNTPSNGATIDLLARSRAADGAWSAVTVLSEGLELAFGQAHQLAIRPDGVVCAAWRGAAVRTDPRTIGIYVRCHEGDAGWSPTGGRAEVPTAGNRREFRPAYLPDGSLVHLSIVDADTLLFGDGLQLTDGLHNVSNHALAVAPDGTLHAAWISQSDPYTVLYRSSSDGGATWSEPAILSSPASAPLQVLALATAKDGTLHLAWSGQGLIWHRQRTPEGAWSDLVEVTQGAPRSLSTTVGLAIGADGLARIAWHGSGVYLARQDASGVWAAARLIADVAGSGAGPALGVDEMGRVHSVWQGEVGADDLFYTLVE